MLDELRLLRSEMEDAKRARQNTALVPKPAALPAPETSAAPPAAKEHEAVKELEAVKLQAELARLKAEVRDLNQEKQEVRRQVVREMSEDWGALSDVIRSTLLEKNVSSPSAEKALDAAAAAAAAAAADKTKKADKAAGGSGCQDIAVFHWKLFSPLQTAPCQKNPKLTHWKYTSTQPALCPEDE